MSSRIVYSVHIVLHLLFQAPSTNFIKKKSVELKKITYRKSPGVPELEVNTKQRTFTESINFCQGLWKCDLLNATTKGALAED